MMVRQPKKRRGLSLLEVLLALAIFLMSLIAIGSLVSIGADRALDVQQKGEAARLCQSKLAEVIAGAVPLSSQSDTPFDEDANWLWSLDAEQGTITGVWNVNIQVSRTRPDGSRITSSVQQMVLDPSLRGSTLDAAAAASAASSSSSSSSGSSGTSSSSPNSSSQTSTPAAASGPGATASKTATTPAATSSAPKTTTSAASTPSSSAPKSSSSPSSPKAGGK